MHDMDAFHPGALCGSVFEAIRPVSALPGAQRGSKGAPKMKIFASAITLSESGQSPLLLLPTFFKVQIMVWKM